MSKVKILITVEGGIVQSIGATSEDVEILVIDYDIIDKGEESIGDISKPDYVFEPGEAHQVMTDLTFAAEREAKDILKNLKF